MSIVESVKKSVNRSVISCNSFRQIIVLHSMAVVVIPTRDDLRICTWQFSKISLSVRH
jgi:hypothetical protein